MNYNSEKRLIESERPQIIQVQTTTVEKFGIPTLFGGKYGCE